MMMIMIKKKKVLAAWSDEDNSSSLKDEYREIANLFLMAKEDSDVNDSDSFFYSSYYSNKSENEDSLTFGKSSKRLISDLEKSIEKCKIFEKENNALQEKIISLEKELKDSKLVLTKFTTGNTILIKFLSLKKDFMIKQA